MLSPRRHEPGEVVFVKVADPLRAGDALVYDLDDVERALDAAARGGEIRRRAVGGDAAPTEAEVRAVEARLSRMFTRRARGSLARAVWWAFLGPAISLLWINSAGTLAYLFFWIGPVAAFVATLGGITGGIALAAVIGAAPALWAWRRAWRHWREARRSFRFARLLSGRRYRQSPFSAYASPALASFNRDSSDAVVQIRKHLESLPERGADGANEAALYARTWHRQATVAGVPAVAGAAHALYVRLGVAEQAMARVESAGSGILSERKVAGEARRARREIAARLAPYCSVGKVTTRAMAPFGAFVAGSLVLALVVFITGIYWVEPDQAAIIDTPQSRAIRLVDQIGRGLGMIRADAPVSPQTWAPETVRDIGFHWGPPRPFVSRHAVFLGTQRVFLRARFVQTGPNEYEGIVVMMTFRIADLNRWALYDEEGSGLQRLSVELSAFFQQSVVDQARRNARDVLARQNSALANDPERLGMAADQLVRERMDDLARAFLNSVTSTEGSAITRQAGVQLSRDGFAWDFQRFPMSGE